MLILVLVILVGIAGMYLLSKKTTAITCQRNQTQMVSASPKERKKQVKIVPNKLRGLESSGRLKRLPQIAIWHKVLDLGRSFGEGKKRRADKT